MAVFIAALTRVVGRGLMEFVRTALSRTLFQSMISSADNRAGPKRHTTATAAKAGLNFMVIFPFEARTWRIGEVNRRPAREYCSRRQ